MDRLCASESVRRTGHHFLSRSCAWIAEFDRSWCPPGTLYSFTVVAMHAMPIMIGVLCILAIAYRYYSAFLAARVAVLDDSRVTPAFEFNDGQNFHPTHKWVLFGHHFAAISGAGPLIGPVLAIQFGYLPGLIWLVVGVCLAGAVQDMLVLAASVRVVGGRWPRLPGPKLAPWPAPQPR